MSIVSLKQKNDSAKSGNDNAILKKLEVINPSFKSTPTIIARDLTIEGEINSSGLVEIEGRIKGSINGNSIILRENGIVEGTITAESLSIRGSFEGKIKAKNIDISGKARIIGEVEYQTLSIEDGACIDGHFKKID
jgi:cytoskeletal protein CcmA (bactofilin family)